MTCDLFVLHAANPSKPAHRTCNLCCLFPSDHCDSYGNTASTSLEYFTLICVAFGVSAVVSVIKHSMDPRSPHYKAWVRHRRRCCCCCRLPACLFTV